jgi:hypothetical protein
LGNANLARVNHMICHLAPNVVAVIALANGSMPPNQSGKG